VDLERLAAILGLKPPTSEKEVGKVNESGTSSFPTDKGRIGASQDREVHEPDKSVAFTDPANTKNTSESTSEISSESHPYRMRAFRAQHHLLKTDDTRSKNPPQDIPPESYALRKIEEQRDGHGRVSSTSTPVADITQRHSSSDISPAHKGRVGPDNIELQQVFKLLELPGTEPHRALLDYWEDKLTETDVIKAVCHARNAGPDDLDWYVEATLRCIKELEAERKEAM
jgi:hypothetical protein